MITLELPLPPSTNKLWTRTKRGMRLSDAAVAFKQEVFVICFQQGVTPLEGRVALEIEAFLRRSDADLDNVQKALIDSLQGYAFGNDHNVWRITANKHIDKANPRVVVRITAL